MKVEETWAQVILSALLDGKEATNQEIYEVVEESWAAPDMLVATKWGARPRYQHVVRSTLSGLAKSGLVARIDRGVYSITSAGRFMMTGER